MAFKNAVIRSSLVFKDVIGNKQGFNLTQWVDNELVNLGVINNIVCCETSNVYIKQGIVSNLDKGFSLNSYLRKILNRFGIVLNNYCCKDKEIFISKSDVFYNNENKKDLDLVKYIKNVLDKNSITYNDLCC